MSDVYAAGASGTSLAAAAFAATGSILSGYGQQQGDDYRAAQLDASATAGRAAATQAGGQLTQRLGTLLDSIDVARAAARDDPTSPSGAAVRQNAENIGLTQESIETSNKLIQSQQDQNSAAYMKWAGGMAMLGGAVGAAGSLFKNAAPGLPA